MQNRTPLHDQEPEKQEEVKTTVDSEVEIARIQAEMRKTIEDDRRKAMKMEGDVEDEEELLKSDESSEQDSNSQPSSVEQEAKSKGWKPKDQFTGNPEQFISAAEFIKNEGLYNEISGLRKKLKNQDKAMKTMHDLMFNAEERNLKERVDYYEPQVKAAKESGNIDEYETWKKRFEESKNALDNLKKTREETVVQEKPKEEFQPEAEVVDFVKRNAGWFKSTVPEDRAMQQFAIAEEVRIKQDEPGLSWSDLMNKVEKSVKDVFAHRFENKNRTKPPAIAVQNPSSARNASTKKTQYTFKDDCPKEYRQAVRECALKFNMTLDDYTNQLYLNNILKK